MPQRLLESLTLGHCSHEFSWPRRADDGHYYQVCLLCADEYKYDWKAMRRTERTPHTSPEAASASHRSLSHSKKPTWVPRARRVRYAIPMRYRVKPEAAWYAGKVENLSQSGILFRGVQHLPPETMVEMRFEMPEEISGQKNSLVLCQGQITRSPEKQEAGERPALAAAILDYQFLRER